MTIPVLKSLSASIVLNDEEPITSNINVSEITSELENIRALQSEINGIITEKIASLKAENKLPEVEVLDESECESDDNEE